jgi:DNA-binding CsgD family transcriptional regulator
VLQLIMQGKTNLEIGEQLFISPRTVAAHRTNLLRKTGAKNSAELVKYAMTSELAFN